MHVIRKNKRKEGKQKNSRVQEKIFNHVRYGKTEKKGKKYVCTYDCLHFTLVCAIV
jgi:hypothetical protein